jgi:hypothetical protein
MPLKNWKKGSAAAAAALLVGAGLVRAGHGDADHGRSELLHDGAVVGHLAVAADHRHRRRCGGDGQRGHLQVASALRSGRLQAGLGLVQQIRTQAERPGGADSEHAGSDQGSGQGIGLHRMTRSAWRGTFRMPAKIGPQG